ncbi:hypothetical protein JCGZ_11954 [Jatropha curcas]|uniref:Aminotransferase-like plant mobile domain-containing protein n=1 Tax=Jatropha curcas TaxID=180498 RepID=A0A067KEH7_JATCU|nr:hypothetical protein JCGZ_11954 [Jatropha curcas]
MSQLSEIHAFAYTPEMETLGANLDIPTFDGEPVPVSRNPLTSGTRPLQLLLLPGTEFPVDLGKARSGGLSTDASAFWDLLDPPMRARVVAVGFGDYAAGLRRTQPHFPPAMRYALMERWNDCTHTFVFGFNEMTLTPIDYAAVTGLWFAGPVAPLDARYQTATLGAQLVRSLLGVTTQTRELPVDARPAAPAYTREERDQAARSFLFYIISSQLLCTSQNKGDPAVLVCLRDLGQVGSFDWVTLALAHLYHGLDVLTRGSGESNWQFIRPLERRVSHAPPRHMCMLEGMTAEDREEEYEGSAASDFLSAGDYPAYFSTRMQARLPEVLEYTQERKKHKTEAHYRAEAAAEADAAAAPAGPVGVVLGDVLFRPGMEVVLDPGLGLGLGLGSGIIIPADLRQAPPLPQLDPEHTTHVPAQRYLEVCQRFGFAWSFIAQLYSECHERDLEIGRVWRHQSRQSGAMARLQMEVDRLRMRLEVEGIPLDFSEEDDDGSSSDDAPPLKYPPTGSVYA